MLAWAPARRTPVRASHALVQQSRHRLIGGHNPLHRRTFTTSDLRDGSSQGSLNIAVLGGGITGLTSAYYLLQQLPKAQITLLEGSSRLGGWLHSKQIDVGTGKIVFEQGPRTLRPSRPNGWITLDLVSKNDIGPGRLLIKLVRYTTWD